jgi:DNA polymerase bacteriophage-type
MSCAVPILFHDFETRSRLELKRVGAHRYSKHSTTDVLCCAYAVDGGEVKIWKRGDPVPPEFIEAAANPEWTTSAHNDQFERLITQNIMAPRYGWPIVPIERRRCSMAAGLALALPGKLEKVAKALSLSNHKDVGGHRLMLRMSRPRKPRVGEDPAGVYWIDDTERLYAYCRQDVEVERELHHRLRPLIPAEQARWQADTAVNDRGFHADAGLAMAMARIADAAKIEIDAELEKITVGAVTSVGQVDRLSAWLGDNGCKVDDVQKVTLGHALRRKDLSDECRRVIELRIMGAHAAAAKPLAFLERSDDDGRVRGAFIYHGASTGRWSSLGIQVQNLKRPDGLKDIAEAIEAVATGSLEHVRTKYSQPLAVIGAIVRALVCAAPGCRLIAADFSGIESRITAWLADEKWKIEQWTKFDRTKDPEDEPYLIIGRMLGVPEGMARTIGKIADLAFGFMGSIGAWRAMCKLYRVEDNRTDDEVLALQRAWRKAHPNVVRFWDTLNRGAILATKNLGQVIRSGPRISWRHESGFLFMRLPTGRELAYPFAELMTTDRDKPAVTFMDNQQGKWVPCHHGRGAYGGIWMENAVSATARDVFACAMPRLEAASYPVVFHVHDEIVAEVPLESEHTVQEFERIITEPPAWADGMPIAAKGRNGPRFLKTEENKSNPKKGLPWPPEDDDEPPIASIGALIDAGPIALLARARMTANAIVLPPAPEITVFTRTDGPLTKRIHLDDAGRVISDGGACRMARGRAQRVRIGSMSELAALITSLRSNDALALGALRTDLPEEVEVVTANKLNGPGPIARTTEFLPFRSGMPALVLFDFDRKGMPADVAARVEAAGGFWGALVSILPGLRGAPHLIRRSTSAGLYRADTGERFPDSGGEHVYVRVADGADIPRFLADLHARAWLHGFGWCALGADGKVLYRSIIDPSVGAPERLIYEGPPILVWPIAQDRPPPEVGQ